MNAIRSSLLLAALVAGLGLYAGCDATVDPAAPPSARAPLTDVPAALPDAGPAAVPLLPAGQPEGLSASGSVHTPADTTWLTPEERSMLLSLLRSAQRLTGSDYVAVTSLRQRDGSYKYRFRTFKVKRSIRERSGGELFFYTYQRKRAWDGSPTILVAALVPHVPDAALRMNNWVRRRFPTKGTPGAAERLFPDEGVSDRPVTPDGAGKATVEECGVSNQLVYHAECGCWGYEGIEVCSGGDVPLPPDDPPLPDDDGPWGCDNPYGCDDGGSGGPAPPGDGGWGEEECDPQEITCVADYPPEYFMRNDFVFAIPDCENIQSDMDEAWCNAVVPTGVWLERTHNALNRIEQRGPECAVIAARGRELLGWGLLRYYPHKSHYGFLGLGSPGDNYGVVTSDLLVEQYYEDGMLGWIGLDWSLSHEIEHTLGRGHATNEDGSESKAHTPHSRLCSGM